MIDDVFRIITAILIIPMVIIMYTGVLALSLNLARYLGWLWW